MGLSATIKAAVKNAIVAIDDLATRITFVSVVPGAYNPATDAVTVTETTYTNVPCALVKLSEDDLDWWPANTNGQKCLIPYLDLPIVTSDDDYVVIDSIRWNIHRRKQVPGSSIHILYIREP